METKILQEQVYRNTGYIQEPWRELNNICKKNLNGKHYKVLFYNIEDCNKMPEVLKFVAFDWEDLKILVYREPEVKILSFDNYNQALDLIKKSEEKLISEGIKIHSKEDYKRIFLFKDIGKHEIKEITKGDKTIKIGDFLSTCWGYDQTNVEMFVVKKILGKNYLIIQEISQIVAHESMTYDMVKVSPTIEKIDIPIKAFISDDGYMHVCEWGYKRGLNLTKPDEEHYRTNPQFGH